MWNSIDAGWCGQRLRLQDEDNSHQSREYKYLRPSSTTKSDFPFNAIRTSNKLHESTEKSSPSDSDYTSLIISAMSFYKQVDQADAVFSADKINFHPRTGISVLVVGAGVGGLMSALECRRKGHDVRIIERAPALSTAGRACRLALL